MVITPQSCVFFPWFQPASQVEAVVREAVRDAKSVMPQYLRVDFLVDKQGVVDILGWEVLETLGIFHEETWDKQRFTT